jgi:hypothetical protein
LNYRPVVPVCPRFQADWCELILEALSIQKMPATLKYGFAENQREIILYSAKRLQMASFFENQQD